MKNKLHTKFLLIGVYSRMMGHSDIKTTTIYLAANTEHLRSMNVEDLRNEINKLSVDSLV